MYINNNITKPAISTSEVQRIVDILIPNFAAIDYVNFGKTDGTPDRVSVSAELLAWDTAYQLVEAGVFIAEGLGEVSSGS